MVAGSVANVSVGWVLLFNSQARTARNLFILNLAFSDILVCLVTIPLTALRMYNSPSWNLGVNVCRLIG